MKLHKQASMAGFPLPRTGPAEVERFLIEKIQQDLGSFKNLVTITPVLRVDSEDGDLSGNITNGYGNIMLSIGNVKVHVPFIISNKTLLPFDTIRMGNQQVSYDSSKLRKIVNGIDRKLKSEDESGEGGDFAMGQVVDRKNVRSNNGFLGTIMQVRDAEMARHGNGTIPFSGPDFGTLDDTRVDHYASADLDVLDAFGEVMQKLASVNIIPENAVQEYLVGIEKQASAETEAFRNQMINVKTDTLEEKKVQREISKLDKEQLADVRRAASGNDIVIPMTYDGHFEHRSARVYHKLSALSLPVSEQNKKATKISSIVLDHKGGYRFLENGDKFMMTVREPRPFKLPEECVRGLKPDRMYSMELGPQEISLPFTVKSRYMKDDIHGMNRRFLYYNAQDAVNHPTNSLFLDVIECEEQTTRKVSSSPENVYRATFKIVVSREESFEGIQRMDEAQMEAYITKNAMFAQDAMLARHMTGYAQRYILCGPNVCCFELKKIILGHFTEPKGYLTEGAFSKTAAYNHLNQVKLVVVKDRMPRTFAIEMSMAAEAEAGGASAVQHKKHRMDNLSESQARKALQDLGYDHRKIAMFFEIAKRNGRQASFEMPSPEKAKSMMPSAVGAQQKEIAAGNIAKAALNANNFTPVMEDLAANGFSEMLGQALGGGGMLGSLGQLLKSSSTVATEIEKLAHRTQGAAWHELSALLNVKHRLDKLAYAVADRNIVTNVDGLFEKVASMMPKVATYQRDLIELGRKQRLEWDRPIIEPAILKQAVAHLDGFARYARFASERGQLPGKTEAPVPAGGDLKKDASFFSGYRNMGRASRLHELNPMIQSLKNDLSKTHQELKKRYISLRAQKNMGSPDPNQTTRLQREIRQFEADIKRMEEELAGLGMERAEIEQVKTNRQSALTAAIGAPSLATVTFGYQTFQND